jgi:alkyl sulfatase BDS1-like metallo-beta-lactamase superfamily hydrolase
MKIRKSVVALLCGGLLLAGCTTDAASPLTGDSKGATEFTKTKNADVYATLNFDDKSEQQNAAKGLLASPDSLEIKDADGKVVWSQDAYSFLNGDPDAPDTANPSLWQNAKNNHLYGLFEVMDGIYQVRGYDMANMTFIRGDKGWIIFDPLMSIETAQAALQLANDTLGYRPVSAVVISHSHVDHFGGVQGVVTDQDLANGVPIIVPEGFAEEAVSENVYSGTAMGRRGAYQYGAFLDKGETGSLGVGIGLGQSLGTISYLPPTDEIKATGETRTVDGITMEFQMTPGTEAPAEMNTWFPQFNALWMAENATASMHNLYTLRGAKVRDGNRWALELMKTVNLYGDKATVSFEAHNWPHWGTDVIKKYLTDTAAAYKYINDQTLLYINQGYTGDEIAQMVKLPDDLAKNWYTRQYYGTVEHNARAVYQRFMGYYDSVPADLNPLPKTESAAKLVEYLGDVDKVIEKARKDFDNGEYQWVSEIMQDVVFAQPENEQARYLLADAYEQLGYAAESATWRNEYLGAAKELRNGGVVKADTTKSGIIVRNMTPTMVLDYLGIREDTSKVADLNATINLKLTDDTNYLITIRAGVVLYEKDAESATPDATWTTTKQGVISLTTGDADIAAKAIQVTGDQSLLPTVLGAFGEFDSEFPIVMP